MGPAHISDAASIRKVRSSTSKPPSALVAHVSPVPTMAVPTFHALYAAGFFGVASPSASPLPWPSSEETGLGSQLLPYGSSLSTRQASLHAADRWLAPSQRGLDPALRRPGLPERRRAAMKVTWFLLRPDLHRLVIVNFQDAISPGLLALDLAFGGH